MSLGALLTVIGAILAIYALARPPQRKSIDIFVPLWPIVSGIALSAGLLIALEVLTQWKIESPAARFILGLTAFLAPIGVTIWAVILWYRARLSSRCEPRFRDLLLSCLRDDVYDEAVRILTKNKCHLADVLTEDTADLIFNRRFIEAMVRASSWLHLDLLKKLPNHCRAVDRTFRALLASEDSLLRTAALVGEGGDETLRPTKEDDALIKRTLENPEWFHRCRAGRPLVITVCHMIESASLNEAYNRADALYGARQGITPRSKCPVFLSIKTIAHALKASIEHNSCTTEDTHQDAADLWWIFRAILEHSVYSKETWDETFGYGEYPTPFGFLLAEILRDYYDICADAWHRSHYGKNPPPDILAPVVRMWANCVMLFTEDKEQHVSAKFRGSEACRLLDMTLQQRQTEIHTEGDRGAAAVWTELFVERIKEEMTPWLPASRRYLGKVLDGMDWAKDYIGDNRDWLRQQLKVDEEWRAPD